MLWLSSFFGWSFPKKRYPARIKLFRDHALARPTDREPPRLDQRVLHRRVREQRQRVLGDRAVVARALDRVFQRAGAFFLRPHGFEVGGGGVGVLPRSG